MGPSQLYRNRVGCGLISVWGENCIIQVNEDSYWALACDCRLCVGVEWGEGQGLNKGTIMPATTLVLEKAASPTLTLKSDNSVPPHMSLVLCKLLTLC